MIKLVEGAWAGQPAYVIGGGKSLSAFDFKKLRGVKNRVVINRAWKDCYEAEVWFSEDERVITEMWGEDPLFQTFKGLKVLHALAPGVKDRVLAVDPTLHVIERKREDKYWSRSFHDGLSMSSCSGVGAVNLVWLLGADPIYLLGFDCRTDGNFVQNYHKDYLEKGWDWQTGGNNAEVYKSDMELWVHLHTQDRAVVNVINPKLPSAVTCWPTMTFDEVFK